jgi:hypothetical protein
MLRKTEVGCFLVRESDSRHGYSLTFKAENRCRYFVESIVFFFLSFQFSSLFF